MDSSPWAAGALRRAIDDRLLAETKRIARLRREAPAAPALRAFVARLDRTRALRSAAG